MKYVVHVISMTSSIVVHMSSKHFEFGCYSVEEKYLSWLNFKITNVYKITFRKYVDLGKNEEAKR